MTNAFRIMIIASPSGAGKTTLYRRLLQEFADLRFSVSTTTRERRSKEVDGRDYHFVETEEFLTMIEQGAFVEWEEVHGKHYGTTHAEIQACRAEGKSLFLDLDYRGALQIKKAYPEATTVFLLPPSMDELERRIRTRGENTEEQIRLRMKNASSEIEHYADFDFIVVNDDIDESYDQLRSIFVAASCRTSLQLEVGRRLIRESSQR